MAPRTETTDHAQIGHTKEVGTSPWRVDGVGLATSRPVYFAVNKPPGVVSTSHDPAGRPPYFLITSEKVLWRVMPF